MAARIRVREPLSAYSTDATLNSRFSRLRDLPLPVRVYHGRYLSKSSDITTSYENSCVQATDRSADMDRKRLAEFSILRCDSASRYNLREEYRVSAASVHDGEQALSEYIFLFSRSLRGSRTPRGDRSGKYGKSQEGTGLKIQTISQTNSHCRRNRLRFSLSCYHCDSVSVSRISLCYQRDSTLLSEVFV